MTTSLGSIVSSIATVTLIAVATRWLATAKGSDLPENRDGINFYRIKWQWRAVGLVGGFFAIAICILVSRDSHSRPNGVLIGITVVFVAACLSITTGSVTTDQAGITKKGLWRNYSLQWKAITEIRLHKKQGGAIELRATAQKLVIDSRLNAFQHLLNEIEDRTRIRPTGAL
ncbi:MAG: hypothetical protein WCC03_02670 [Candidatus Acidiferrales bacterium]